MTTKNDYGDKLIRDFLKVFDSYAMSNKPYGRLILHILLGQALKHVYFRQDARKIDIRLHGLLIRPSGSGKGAGYGFFCRMAEDLGIDNQTLTEATDAGLVGTGTVDKDGNAIINEGIMKGADLVSMEEASPMFDYESSFSKKNLTYLQIAMNPLYDAPCMISKKIGSLPTAIRFKPHCSFLLMTYIPDKFLDALVKRGVIQRFVTIIQDVGLDERMKTVDKAIDRLNLSQEAKHEEMYNSVRRRLKEVILNSQKLGGYEEHKMKTRWNDKYIRKAFEDKIRPKLKKNKVDQLVDNLTKQLESFEDEEWYLKHGYCFNISDKSREEIREVEHELVEMIKDTTETAQDKLAEFTHRLFEILVRLAIQHAILRMVNEVQTEDVIYARRVYKPIWQETIYFIEDNLLPTNMERLKINRVIQGAVDEYHILLKENKLKHVKENVWVRKGTLVKNLQKRWDNCSYVTAVKRFSKIETSNPRDTNKNKWFLMKKIGNVPYVNLTQDVAE